MPTTLQILNEVIDSRPIQVLFYPLVELKLSLKNLLIDKKDKVRSSTRAICILIAFVIGCLLPYQISPSYGEWSHKALNYFFGTSLFSTILTVYGGAWTVSTPTAWGIKHLTRAITNCIFGDPDFFLTEKQVEQLSKVFGDEIDAEEIREIFDFCVKQYRNPSDAFGAGRDDFARSIEGILKGDLGTFLEQESLLLTQQRHLIELQKKLKKQKKYVEKITSLHKIISNTSSQSQTSQSPLSLEQNNRDSSNNTHSPSKSQQTDNSDFSNNYSLSVSDSASGSEKSKKEEQPTPISQQQSPADSTAELFRQVHETMAQLEQKLFKQHSELSEQFQLNDPIPLSNSNSESLKMFKQYEAQLDQEAHRIKEKLKKIPEFDPGAKPKLNSSSGIRISKSI